MNASTKKGKGQVRDQVSERFGDVVEQVRTPLIAALGAGDLATQAVADLLNKARAQVERGEKPETPVDVTELRGHLDAAELDKLVDPQELRKLVDPGELRDLVDAYSKAASDLYHYLAEHGQSTLDKLRENPQVAKALDQLEDAVSQAQDRIGDAAGDARDLAEEVLNRANLRERSDKAAEVVSTTSQNVAKAGEKVAANTKKAAEKVTAQQAEEKTGTQQAKPAAKPASKSSTAKSAPRPTSTTRKSTDSKSSEAKGAPKSNGKAEK